MASKIPASFKPLTPFIRRAEELDRDPSRPETKLVAFYCRQYAMELGIKLREKDGSEEATQYLLSLMGSLEEEKSKMPHFSQEEGQQICESFAYEIFNKADEEDRAMIATKNTARTFYAAGTFFDILKQFGEPSEEIAEKTRYSKWKAADILKAIKEGRTPMPGAPGEEISTAGESPVKVEKSEIEFPNMAVNSVPDSYSAANIPVTGSEHLVIPPVAPQIPPAAPQSSPLPPPSYSPPPAINNAESQMNQPPRATNHYSPPISAQPSRSKPIARGGKNKQNVDDALECARFAVAALKVNDAELGIERLEQALNYLRNS